MKKLGLFIAVLFMLLISVQTAYAVFCSNCGSKSSQDANFCKKCGSKLQDDGDESTGYVELSKKPSVREGQIFSESASRILTHEELISVGDKKLELARNEIYARHGWIFNRKDLDGYFKKKSWYTPRGDKKDREKINKIIEKELNETEKKNIDLILKYEKAS